MFFIDELQDMRIYRKQFLLPLDEKNKRKNSMAFVMGKNVDGSIRTMKFPLMYPKYYNAYYLERAVMYYINQEGAFESDEEVITESLEDIIEGEESKKIIFKGYNHDIENVRQYINVKVINALASDYKVKIKYPITINVVGRSGKKENTKDQIWVLSKSTFNRSIKGYDMYLYYNVMELILMNANPKMSRDIKYAVALYESGLYEAHKSTNWIFGSKLKTLCKALENYDTRNGHKKMAKVLCSSPESIFANTAKDYFKTDLINFLNIFESAEEEFKLSTDPDFIQINESQYIGMPITEDASYNSLMKRTLYADRFKSINELKAHYDKMKKEFAGLKYTYNSLEMYKGLNVFVDLSHYIYSYLKNTSLKKVRGYNLFNEMLTRLINDKRYTAQGYKNKTVLINVSEWAKKDIRAWMIQDDINPISWIYYSAMMNPAALKQNFGGVTFVFMGTNSPKYFKIDFNTVDMRTFPQRFIRNIKYLINGEIDGSIDIDTDTKESSPKAIKTELVDKVEKSQGLKIDDISVDDKKPEKKSSDTKKVDKPSTTKEEDKKKIVQTIAKAAEKSSSEDETIDDLDKTQELQDILANLSAEADNKSNISAARASRMIKLQNDIMDKQFKGKSIRDLTKVSYDTTELKEESIKVDSVNEEWEHMTFPTQEQVYDMDSDIVQIFNQFADKSYPLAVRDIKAEDISNGENAVMMYTVSYESAEGKRFSIKLEIPKWIDNKYLLLRGNKKDIPNQLFLMPIIKTDTDTVQVVTNYNKIFIERFGTTTGKSFITADKLIKAINKGNFKSLKVELGDNTKICNRYELPIDYIDLAGTYSKLSVGNLTIYFNQNELREKYGDKIDDKMGIPIGTEGNNIIYWNSVIGKENEFMSCSSYIALLLATNKELAKESFNQVYDEMSRSIRYTYSRASILSTKMPLVLICTYSEGLTRTLKKANIEYHIEDNKRKMDPYKEDFIKFKDAYLIYNLDYASSLLLNGLKACPTSEYSIGEIDSRSMYVEFLELFGGRILADRLDNFYNLLIDKPITYNTLQYYNLPTDYVEVLLYANRLLADNKFVKHTRITNNRRVRRQEQIPAILYGVMSSAYGQYCIDMKHGRANVMTVKQSAVVDAALKNSTTSDKSIINALGEYEAYNAVTPKGPSGMNSDRSYTLDKRGYDPSMLNVIGMSTGFAGNVGITRQMTIDANISTARGYVRENEEQLHELSPTKSLCMTEALTPFGVTRDDPFRTAMTFIQTSKHGIRCKRSNPALITSGADEALPYMVSNIFAYKAKQDGTVTDINDDRMIIEYKDGSHEYIDLSTKIEKNSSSGFYVTLKLDTDLKVGNKVKSGDIIAYDKQSFSDNFGATDNLAYNIGTLAKTAILATDEGFEDSSIISQDMSDAMTSDIVLKIEKIFDKDTNIYNLIKVGQSVEEGDTLLIAQAGYDEESVNTLLRNLNADDEDDITELGRIPIKSKVTGIVQDIKFFRTVELNELSPTLKKYVSAYEKNIKAKQKEMEEYGAEDAKIATDAIGKLPPTGRLKNADNGVLIEIYLTYEDRMSVGDKLIYYSANKGVVKDIFPEGKEPKSSYRPKEKIHSLLAMDSINGRMVSSIQVNGGIYKGLIELARHCKDILGIKYPDDLF